MKEEKHGTLNGPEVSKTDGNFSSSYNQVIPQNYKRTLNAYHGCCNQNHSNRESYLSS